jgi:hypothetical protein
VDLGTSPLGIFKIAPNKESSISFKNVPRDYLQMRESKSTAAYPPVGGYRPKYSYVSENLNTSKVGYGTKPQWNGLGQK